MYQDTSISTIYKPVFLSKDLYADKEVFNAFLVSNQDKIILDLFESQKKELIRIRHPRRRLKSDEIDAAYAAWLGDRDPGTHGLWVLYPWSNRLLHIVDQPEFIELRTSRNQFKITPSEQEYLSQRTVGIIGLSVGHAVAVTMATERVCGKLKLADFDTIELSNLNRIRTGLHNIGINKSVVTAREISEIDPFLEVECFTTGITNENLEPFLLEGGRLDILIDECDDIGLKIRCRRVAALHQIPVVMETSDRGMLDVERFDLEPERPIFHGLLSDIPAEKFENLSEADKLPMVLKIINAVNASKRGKASLVEMGQTISTWPQLASAVTLGAGVVTDVCRRILLNKFTASGRYYIDLETLAGNEPALKDSSMFANPYQPFSVEEAVRVADSLAPHEKQAEIGEEQLNAIVAAACQAPSTGNDQPWKWLYRNGRLHLFHDRYRSYSFGDFDQIASNLSFGAAYENLLLKSREAGFAVQADLFPLGMESTLIAAIHFLPEDAGHGAEPVYAPESVAQIFERTTNRNPSVAVEIPEGQIDILKQAAESISGARFYYYDDKETVSRLAAIVGECDRIRLLNPTGHHDFVHREMKWSPRDAEEDKDGIDVRTLGMDTGQMTALSIIRDEYVIDALRDINGAGALVDVARKSFSIGSGLGMITMPAYTYEDFFRGGMSMERLWLKAEELGYAIHPQISPFYLFPRITHGNNAGLSDAEADRLKELRQKFLEIVPFEDNIAEVFLFKIASAPKPDIKSYRLPLAETLFIVNP